MLRGVRRRDSEREGETRAEAALVLGEEQQSTVAQDVGLVALGEEVAHVEQRFQAFRAVAGDADGLAEVQIQVGLGSVLREGRTAVTVSSGCQL